MKKKKPFHQKLRIIKSEKKKKMTGFPLKTT